MLEVKSEQKIELHALDEVSAGKLLDIHIKESDDGDKDEAVSEKEDTRKK